MEDKAKLTIAEIRAMFDKVLNDEIEPYEEDTPDWANTLYELSEKPHIGADGIEAAIQAIDEEYVSSDFLISQGKFEKFMDEAYKMAHDSKAAWGKEQAYEFFDKDTLDRMEDYINWSDYADSYSDSYHFVDTPRKVHVFDADFEF